MRILITGAAGYIGRHLLPRLRADGNDILPIYRIGNNFKRGTCPWLETDLSNPRCVEILAGLAEMEMGGQSIDTVIHLAGRVDISLQPNPQGAHFPPIPGVQDIHALYRDNVLATANVVDYCQQAGVKHLIYASTLAVYGYPDRDSYGYLIPSPLEHYAASKRAAEVMLETATLRGLKVTTLRLPGIYGGDRKSGVVYQMCRDALTKSVVRITAPYPLPLDVLHIEDVVEAFAAALQRGNSGWTTLDATSTEPCSLSILAQDIADLVSGCSIEPGPFHHPRLDADRGYLLPNWHPKPRKERLRQVLEEIRHELSS